MEDLFGGLDSSSWPELAEMVEQAYRTCERLKLERLSRTPRKVTSWNPMARKWSVLVDELSAIPINSGKALALTHRDGDALLQALRIYDGPSRNFGWSMVPRSSTEVWFEKFEKGSRQGRSRARAQRPMPILESLSSKARDPEDLRAVARVGVVMDMYRVGIRPHPAEAEFAELALKFYSEDTSEDDWKLINDQQLPKLAAQIKFHKKIKGQVEAALLPLFDEVAEPQKMLEAVYGLVHAAEVAGMSKVEELEARVRDLRARLAERSNGAGTPR